MRPTLTLITLGVADLARSLKFYRDGLQWETKSKLEDGVIFLKLNNIVLGLWPREELAKDAKMQNTPPAFSGIALAHNTKSKEEVDQIFAEVNALGAIITKTPENTFWGGYSGYFQDPDRHLWEVAWNPHWKIDSQGSVILP
ncbi:MAG: VOC family protein [Candidatus Peregrinibacteria bacterium]|nr:VOC family protein [Candidatus Peregrinibacteria bacterium]